jgi:hypothetical protein
MISPSPAQKRVIKLVGYPLFFLLCFWIFLGLTFPGDRFIPIVESKAGAVLGRKVSVGSLSVSPFGSMTVQDLRIAVPSEDKGAASSQGNESEKTDTEQKKKSVPVFNYIIN